MEKIHIIGSGGLAKEIISYIIDEKPRRYEILGVWSDEPFNNESYSIYHKGSIQDAINNIKSDENLLLCVASPKSKRIILKKIDEKSAFNWINYIHPTAIVSSMSSIGKGCIITPQCIITSDAILHDFIFINTGSVVGHDSEINSFSTLFPNTEVCGDCVLGTDCVLGIGVYVVPGVKLPDGTRVRAGSVVWKSPDKAGLLSGNPAVLV